ncbi:ABC transporter permease [Anaerobacillus sp. CMMVII]|uniref:ABC transporter permease n=1 Tax=Anaerobacillus sp. CMMVII TaxID=2755588 RepID=UPI0021B7A2F3|nr:ABC transporter permease [Anaerobacillus sp. CMMVII]MCT8139302.1 ABC transporter permease [Anaerobacillus sp. CMMVII]
MRIKAIVIRIIRQFIRDKRTLGMIVVAPIFILWLVSLVFSGDKIEPIIGVVNGNTALLEQFETVISYDYEEDALKDLLNEEIHGYIKGEETPLKVVLEGSDPTSSQVVLHTVQSAFQNLQPSTNEKVQPEVIYYYGSKEMSTFDNIGPFLIGFFVFFFVFIIAGVSFLRERTSGTLEKLLSTPLRRWEIVIGYVCGFGIFTTIQTAIIVFFSIKVLGMMMEGSIWAVMLITLTLSITALTLGTLLSAFARNELQMIQFIPIVIVPQFFFSGLLNLETMSPWLTHLSKIMPLSYGGEAMRDVMIRGKGLTEITSNLLVLILFSVGFMVFNNFALKKHRKI